MLTLFLFLLVNYGDWWHSFVAVRTDAQKWIAAGVMHPDEIDKFYWRRPGCIDEVADIMNHRLATTPPDAPWFDHPLPNPDDARSGWKLAQAHLDEFILWRDWNRVIGREQVLERAVEEQRRLLRIWALIDDLQCYNWGHGGKRLLLYELRELVGREQFERGEYPYPLYPLYWEQLFDGR